AGPRIVRRRLLILLEKDLLDPGFRVGFLDHYEVPQLPQCDRRGMMGRAEDPVERVGRNRVRSEGPHVTAALDHAIEHLTIRGGKLLHERPLWSSYCRRKYTGPQHASVGVPRLARI